MTDAAPYNIEEAFAFPAQRYLIYFGTGEVTTVNENVGEITKVAVVMFPYIEETSPNGATELKPAGGPRRGEYKGKIVSTLFNEKKTKGHVIFEDGTVIYHDATFLA